MYSNNRGEMFQEWAFYASLDTTITTRSRKITRCCVLLYTEDRSDRTTATPQHPTAFALLFSNTVFQIAMSVLLQFTRMLFPFE